MPIWEFHLVDGNGMVFGQTVVTEGANEADAASAAFAAVDGHPGLALTRPGKAVPPDVEARWREVLGDADTPGIFSDAGRLALYARGIPDPSAHLSTRQGKRGFRIGLAIGLGAVVLIAFVAITILSHP